MTPRRNPGPLRQAAPVTAQYAGVPLDALLPPVHRVGFFLLTIFFFLAFSRVMDVTLPVARLPLVVSAVALLCMVLSGGLARVVHATEGKMLLGFTLWCIICIPFSGWRGGSIGAIRDEWLKSLICFALVVGLTATIRQARRLMISLAFATFVLALMAIIKGKRVHDRLSFDVGMFSNPNDLAQALLLGVPLLFALNVPRSNVFFKIITVAAAAPMLLAIIQTGSRTALLAIGVMIILTFLRAGYKGRAALTLMIAGGAVVIAVALPESVRGRYMAMLGEDDEVNTEEDLVAVASAESRKVLFWQSIRFTIQHPVFGVGPGTFQHASVQETSGSGVRALWRETHNTYTQISSETGIPGFTLYFGTLLVLFRKFRSLRKRCDPDPRLDEVRQLLWIFSTGFIGVLITSAFTSIGYQLLVPTMIGMAAALHEAGLREVERITGAAPSLAPEPKAARSSVAQPRPGRQVSRPVRPQAALTPRMPRS